MKDDMIPIEDLVYHTSPDPKLFKRTVSIKSVQFDPIAGICVEIDYHDRKWPDYYPPGLHGFAIKSTLWAGFYINNVPHVAGLKVRSNDLLWTGNPILKDRNWQTNWTFDNRWAPLNNYEPKVGNKMILFVTAGNARKGESQEPDITTVAERSNIVVVDVPEVNITKRYDLYDTSLEQNIQTMLSTLNEIKSKKEKSVSPWEYKKFWVMLSLPVLILLLGILIGVWRR